MPRHNPEPAAAAAVQAAALVLAIRLRGAGDANPYRRAAFLLEGFAEEGLSASPGIALARRAMGYLHAAIIEDLRSIGEMEDEAAPLLTAICHYLDSCGRPGMSEFTAPAAVSARMASDA